MELELNPVHYYCGYLLYQPWMIDDFGAISEMNEWQWRDTEALREYVA
jgi:hypothetical protein